MGGEMVYILDQRLSAQEIVDQKAAKGTTKKSTLKFHLAFFSLLSSG